MAKLKNTNPSNSTIQRHKLALKDFSKTCKKKKNDFWQKEYDNLEQLQFNNDFWDIWKTFGEEKNSATPQNLSGERCEKHFKELFAKVDANIDEVLQKIERPVNEFLNKEI